jgi:uncharacterized UBP type Zn finger protein
MQKNCEHFMGIQEDEQVNPHTKGCEECEKEGSNWIALRMCLSCGHVGCCDSSPGIHATKHYENTGHPTMIALPDRSWKWCYIHKQYGQ